MDERFDSDLKARLTTDESGRVRGINHTDSFWESSEANPRLAAIEYVNQVAELLELDPDQLAAMHQPVSYLDPVERGTEYRLSEEKQFFDSTTEAFSQTHLNVPVWGSGLTVTVKHNPHRVVSAADTSKDEIRATLPSEELIRRYKDVFRSAAAERHSKEFEKGDERESATAEFVGNLLRSAGPVEEVPGRVGVIRGRFFVYRYDAGQRFPKDEKPAPESEKDSAPGREDDQLRMPERAPTLPLPEVDSSVEDGADYLVAEITFAFPTVEWGDINWLALVELETGSILYLRALASNVEGKVYLYDPITESGNPANGPTEPDGVLSQFSDDVTLPNLDAPANNLQALRGSRASVNDIEAPALAAPQNAAGVDFNFNARTDEFSAVNAYYHTDRFFALVEDLGFPLAIYFNGTSFPVEVDHRGMGSIINAHCVGNGTGGIDHCCYALADTSSTPGPLGIAVDWRVHLHELGGHGVLYEHVNGPNFGFAHSAGDSLAVILNDPESQAPDRFVLTPFVLNGLRRHDRDVASGWAWGGSQDVGGYSSESILATTHFRIYRSIGGDSPDIGRRRFAARMMAYLILRAISTLTPATNPTNVMGFVNALLTVDQLNWTSEGIFGGAYNKVIRWGFERQGLYQAPGAPTPVTGPGQPPAVDVYIDDGRAGEYPYQQVHWNTTTIWNRRLPDGQVTHEEPILNALNYVYVKIKNRGTQTANDVIVRGFHCKPSAGLLWPDDLEAMTTAQIPVGTLGPNNSEEKTIGPFEWTPNTNAYGHDCLLMIVSATGDPSNVDNFTAGEVIPEWRLVPNDNNIGQRNVFPTAGINLKGLLASLAGRSLWVGNPNPGRATMEVKVQLPPFLSERGWSMSFRGLEGNRFLLPYREQRELVIDLQAGEPFERVDVEEAKERDITVSVYADDGLIGGMTYRVDPEIDHPFTKPGARPGTRTTRGECREEAGRLLECLDLSDQSVAKVRLKRVTVDIDIDEGG